MVEYALITLSPLAYVRRVDAPAATKAGYAIVPVTQEAEPAYDPATHRLERADTITDTGITRGWAPIALTQAEIDAAAAEAAHVTSGGPKANWIAALEAGNVTAAQQRKALAWVLREITGLR